jgi:hypothetical protein
VSRLTQDLFCFAALFTGIAIPQRAPVFGSPGGGVPEMDTLKNRKGRLRSGLPWTVNRSLWQ